MSSELGHLLSQWEAGNTSEQVASEILSVVQVELSSTPRATDHYSWQRFLSISRKPPFLTALPNAQAREQWFATVLQIIDFINFNLGDLLRQRVTENPDGILFRQFSAEDEDAWSYSQIMDRVRSTAALFWRDGAEPTLSSSAGPFFAGPRVGIFCANSIGSACCDLACLTEGILVSPLNIHFKQEHLEWIINRLALTVVICDSPDRLDQLLSLRNKVKAPFVIYTLHSDSRVGQPGITMLEEARAQLGPEEVQALLETRPQRQLRDIATVMFTSGSTGLPKGVAFSQRNLVSKRFARAAALPTIGQDEVLLCYLPLFHTFGRFLELLGTIFWGGTYVFAGNPSADSLLAMLKRTSPTGLISVPVRWLQISERVLATASSSKTDTDLGYHLRQIVGDRLNWGLSAAGYLDPKVFRFFNHHGVKLCSGFGMTEGTGGLTMTPLDDYVPGSVGVPLPGTRTRLGENGELQVSGCYIARYLDPDQPAGSLVVPAQDNDDWWLATGDLFRETKHNHLEIVDRIKDIYKNNRGQTIAPRAVESLFEQVPGIKRTFLAGDGRAYNTLLIVPDTDDDILHTLKSPEDRRHYFQHIITAANPALTTCERVVNFTILDRDFSLEQGEITPKGSLRRKTIEQNFATVIADLYHSDDRILACGELRVRIPRWFFRDLGIVENIIESDGPCLLNTATGEKLLVRQEATGNFLIGDLEYEIEPVADGHTVIDLGVFARHPRLWLGNPALIRFSPCKIGWDTPLPGISPHVHLPARQVHAIDHCLDPVDVGLRLAIANGLCTQALFAESDQALAAIKALGAELHNRDGHTADVIRSRLQALANHPVHKVRCRAYQVLVLDQPHPDHQLYLPAFIESGQPFLDQESFAAISHAGIQPHSLTALRKRLHFYRHHLPWPASPQTRQVFTDLFHLLADFGRFHPEYYATIRAELVSWVRHEADPDLSSQAQQTFHELGRWFETRLQTGYLGMNPKAWLGKIAFQEGLNDQEAALLKKVLVGTTFLRESLMLAFEGEDISLQEIGPGGIWVSRIISRFEDSRFRISVNTRTGKHFDLQLIIFKDPDPDHVMQTIYWYLALQGCVVGTPVMPHFGSCRPDLGALSMAYTSDLTIWEKIREFSSTRGPGTTLPSRMRWRQLMVRAMSVVIRGWDHSGRRIIPGLISPYNIVVPEPDFRIGTLLNNLTGWRIYAGPLSLLLPLWRNMVHHTLSHYPWTDFYLEKTWVFDAVVEALGVAEAKEWLADLDATLASQRATIDDEMWPGFLKDLEEFMATLDSQYYQPLVLRGAIQRYDEWDRAHPKAPMAARLDILDELDNLYRLNMLPDIARYSLYRHTVFQHTAPSIGQTFDRLLDRMYHNPGHPTTAMVELSELQTVLAVQEDRLAFTRMAFPSWTRAQSVEVKKLGDPSSEQVIVHAQFADRNGRLYTACEPTSPAEVGFLYRLFLQAGFPKTVSPADKHLVVMDQAEQIVAGVVYRDLDDQTVFLDGVVVSRPLLERGIAAGVMSEFCTRMKVAGIKTIRTQFFLRRFYEKHGFHVDKVGAGLVRYL